MPRTIQADGRTIVVPDDATPEEINQIVGPAPQQASTDPSGRTPTGAPAQGDTRNAAQRWLDNLTTPNPRKEEWQSPVTTGIDRFAQGVAESVIPMISHPLDTAKGIANSVGQAAAQSGGNPIGMGMAMAEPIAQSAAQDFAQNGPAKAIPHMIGQAVGGAATGELTGAALRPALSAIASKIPSTGVFSGKPPISGENFTPSQLRSHAAIIAEGNAGGNPGFIPQNLAKQTGSIIRDTAAQSPSDVTAINGSDPVAAVQAHKQILRNAQAQIDASHDAVLQQVKNVPVNTSVIRQSIIPTAAQLQGIDPADLSAIQGLKDRAANVTTLEGLNEFRKYMNVEDTTLRGNPTYAKSVGTPQLVHDMANSTRAAYYDALEKATGQDFTGLKKMEGGLIQQQGALQAATPRLTGAEAKATAPFDIRNFAGDTIEAAPQLIKGSVLGPAASKAAELLRGTKLGQLQRQLQNFYSDLPQAQTVQLPQARAALGPAMQLGPGATYLGPGAQPGGNPAGYVPPPMGVGSAASRAGRMLPANAIGDKTILPYYPQMSDGERISTLMQMLRQRQPAALPAQASPIQLPSSFGP